MVTPTSWPSETPASATKKALEDDHAGDGNPEREAKLADERPPTPDDPRPMRDIGGPWVGPA